MKSLDLDRPADEVAPTMLGAVLSHQSVDGLISVRITEVEAYGGVDSDPASHAHRGQTPRNAVMFAAPGVLYVYFVYGMHWCANVVCGPVGEASAVLLRAGEVVSGVDLARARRPAARRDSELARGPANLTASLGITGSHNGLDLLARTSEVRLGEVKEGQPAASDVGNGPRVGVRPAADRPWRWWIKDEATVSRYRGLSVDRSR